MSILERINLQLFAEPGAAPSPAPAAETPAAAPSVETPTPAPASAPAGSEQRLNEIWDKENAIPESAKVDTHTPQPAPTQETPITEKPADTPAPAPAQHEKLMNKYDSPGELVKAHASLQKTYTKEHEELLSLRAKTAELEAKLQQPEPAPQPVPAQAPADELANLDAEGVLEKIYADPLGVLKKVAEQVVEGKLKPLESKIAPVVELTEAQQNFNVWTDAVESFNEAHADMKDYVDDMKQYIADNKLQNSKEPEKVLNNAYAHAKAKAADAKIAEANAKIVELEAKLKTSKEDAIKEHLATVRGTQNNIPPSIPGNSSGSGPAMPPTKPSSISEATARAAARIFGG